MRRIGRWLAPAVAAAFASIFAITASTAAATPSFEGTVSTDDWAAYRGRFVMNDGRIVDDANGGISHSEGQGYGLLLAFSASDRITFERIFDFTRSQLLIRDDGLAAWKWEPNVNPHVVDINDASDGDILIAYSLALAGKAWNEPRYTEAATRLATSIGINLLTEANGRTVLKPAVSGFDPGDRPDKALVVNPSYWVFEAMPVLKQLAPQFAWDGLVTSGVEIAAAARFGAAKLPADWVAITPKGLAPAEGFPAVFGYNAIRIPLYMIRAGIDTAFLEPFAERRRLGDPAVIDLTSGKAQEPLSDPGYRAIDALIACQHGTPFPDDLRHFAPTSYYPSTLHLLVLSSLSARGGQCR